jgi:predicted anti-sigma-YlaC factor YlaD
MRLVGQLSNACAFARENISLQLDGEVSEFDRAAVKAHLERCERCRAYAASLARVTDQLRAAPLEQPEIPVVLPHRSRIRVPLGAVQAAAAVAVAAIVGVTSAGLTTGGGQSVSLTAPNSSADQGPTLLKPRGTHRIALRDERRGPPRPLRGPVAIV